MVPYPPGGINFEANVFNFLFMVWYGLDKTQGQHAKLGLNQDVNAFFDVFHPA